jgi:hypothetical protein
MFKIVGLVETKGGGRIEENDGMSNIEVHYICVGTRQNETH